MPRTRIDADDFAEAQRDPKVRQLLDNADALAADLVARGHCPCHLVVNCPGASAFTREERA